MLYYEATAGCGLGWVGSSARARAAPSRSSWVAQRCRCAFHLSGLCSRCPHHAHRPHPYPLLRRPAASFLVLYVSYALPPLLPRSPTRRRHVLPALFAVPPPRPPFIPCLHTPSFCCGTFLRRRLRRLYSLGGCLVVGCVLAAMNRLRHLPRCGVARSAHLPPRMYCLHTGVTQPCAYAN